MGTRRVLLLGCLLLGLHGVNPASDGAIPIWQPTTITQPGKYVVTRNITNTGGYAILVGAPDVSIDLQGFTITGDVGVGFVDFSGDFTIEGGKIIGTIWTGGQIESVSVRRVVLTRGTIVISDSVRLAVIEDNVLHEAHISLDVGSALVRNNLITDSNYEGIDIEVCGAGCQIVGNTIVGAATVGIRGRGVYGARIVNNVIRNCGGDGLTMGNATVVEGNVMTGNGGFGLVVDSTSVYRGNVARDNHGTGCTSPSGNADFCGGAADLSGGDNFMPDRR